MAKFMIASHSQRDGTASPIEVDGEQVIIPGFEEYAFIIHQSLDPAPGGDVLAMTEMGTGATITSGNDVSQMAERATVRLQNMGKHEFASAILIYFDAINNG